MAIPVLWQDTGLIEIHRAGMDPSPVIFVNGIMNSEDDARASALEISRALGRRRRILLFYNPTLNMDGVGPPSDDGVANTALLAGHLARGILREFRRRPVQRVCIIAHSHGVVVTKQALQVDGVRWRKRWVSVAAFGGATLLPRTIAARVQNVMLSTDVVAVGAMYLLNVFDGHRYVGIIPDVQRMIARLIGNRAYENPQIRSSLCWGMAMFSYTYRGRQKPLIGLLAEKHLESEVAGFPNDRNQLAGRLVLFLLEKILLMTLYPLEVIDSEPRITHGFDSYLVRVRGRFNRFV